MSKCDRCENELLPENYLLFGGAYFPGGKEEVLCSGCSAKRIEEHFEETDE